VIRRLAGFQTEQFLLQLAKAVFVTLVRCTTHDHLPHEAFLLGDCPLELAYFAIAIVHHQAGTRSA
jgi:hypothetical protein